MLTKEERDELRCAYTDASSASRRVRMLLDALDEMEAERDELRELLRMERSACAAAEQAADVAIAIKEKAQRERDEATADADRMLALLAIIHNVHPDDFDIELAELRALGTEEGCSQSSHTPPNPYE